jgi:hypothetical protein
MFTWIVRAAVCLLLLVPAAEAGRVKGPASKVFLVQGFRSLTLKVKFKPNEPASIQVIGDGDAPLAVVILGPDGKRVTADTRNTDSFVLRWNAQAAQSYQVKVYNRGGVPVRFRLSSN